MNSVYTVPSAILAPADCMLGLATEIDAERDRKLEAARQGRRGKSQDESLAIAS